jgi:hypothetical protein
MPNHVGEGIRDVVRPDLEHVQRDAELAGDILLEAALVVARSVNAIENARSSPVASC